MDETSSVMNCIARYIYFKILARENKNNFHLQAHSSKPITTHGTEKMLCANIIFLLPSYPSHKPTLNSSIKRGWRKVLVFPSNCTVSHQFVLAQILFRLLQEAGD